MQIIASEVFFHTGLSKTGSTFLQNEVFPKIQGLCYVPTRKYRNVYQSNGKFIKAKKVLVSREFDQQFEHEIKRFAAIYPEAKPIIVLREQGSWIISQYKRFIKNGHTYRFSEFIDIEKNQGRFKVEDLYYFPKIQLLEMHFHHPPLVLLYDELKSNPQEFIKKIADYTGCSIDFGQINFSTKHASYPEHSLKWVKWWSKYLPFEKKLEIHRKPLGFLYNLYANIVRYTILYTTKWLPKNWHPKVDWVSTQEIEKIRSIAANDWQQVLNYVKENS